MADDRPALLPEEAIAALRRDVDDLKSTLSYRTSRRPTGTIDPTFLTTAPVDTLLLNGALVSRITYAGLWEWITTNSLNGTIGVQPFGNGDGSTTFQLPDLRGRVLRGAMLAGVPALIQGPGEYAGADLTTQLIRHSHNGSTDFAGTHAGHINAAYTNIAAGGVALVAQAWGGDNGNHWHPIDESGNVTQVDMRQSCIGVNWIIWT